MANSINDADKGKGKSYKCIKTLSVLCMYGGLRKRAPIIVGCGALILVWFVIWTIIYHKRKLQEQQKLPRSMPFSLAFS